MGVNQSVDRKGIQINDIVHLNRSFRIVSLPMSSVDKGAGTVFFNGSPSYMGDAHEKVNFHSWTLKIVKIQVCYILLSDRPQLSNQKPEDIYSCIQSCRQALPRRTVRVYRNWNLLFLQLFNNVRSV